MNVAELLVVKIQFSTLFVTVFDRNLLIFVTMLPRAPLLPIMLLFISKPHNIWGR